MKDQIIVRYMEIFGGTVDEALKKITDEHVKQIERECNNYMNEYLHFRL